MKSPIPVVTRLLIVVLLSCLSFAYNLRAAAPLPEDLQLVSPDSLPLRASWYSFARWGKYPPSPANWCAGRDDVLYYYSPSFGTNRIIIDDSLVEYPTPVQALSPSLPCGPLGPTYGPDDIWLEIRFDTNLANNIDLILHNATNGFWQIESKTNVADPDLPWTFVDADLIDTKADLFFGPFPDTNPPQNFYRAARVAQPFEIVATNVPSPVGIDYSPAQQALILAVNYDTNNLPNNFAILDTNSTLSSWSGISGANGGNETRLFTAKSTANGLNAGDLVFGSSSLAPATIGWLSADGTTSDLSWAVITNEPNIVQGLYIDHTGIWSNDLLVACAQDSPVFGATQNVWRVHAPANVQLLAQIPASHLEGALTLPLNTNYGPWAGTFITADELQHTTYSITTNGTVTSYTLGIDPDAFHITETNQDLYSVVFHAQNNSESYVVRLPRRLLTHLIGSVLTEQSGETSAPPALFFLRWNGLAFDAKHILLRDYFPTAPDDFFEKCTFAPIQLPTITN